MSQENQLREVVAAILMSQPGKIGPETSLAILDNSLGEAKLRLGLKRLGIQLPGKFRPATFGELHDSVFGTPADSRPGIPKTTTDNSVGELVRSSAGMLVGLDVQDVSALPVANDYWEHEFYSGIFDKSEIAYAVTQSEPLTHFAGFWCAKEALRKCDPSFATVDPATTVVVHGERGRPYFLWKTSHGDRRLPHALSISHAANLAIAVVMACPESQQPSAEMTRQTLLQQGTPLHKVDGNTAAFRFKRLVTATFLIVTAGIVYVLLRVFSR